MPRAARPTPPTIRSSSRKPPFPRSSEAPMATISRPPGRTLRDLRSLTPARVGLGRAGASMPTEALLEFTLDHARARDAVHAAFDISVLAAGLGELGLPPVEVSSGPR